MSGPTQQIFSARRIAFRTEHLLKKSHNNCGKLLKLIFCAGFLIACWPISAISRPILRRPIRSLSGAVSLESAPLSSERSERDLSIFSDYNISDSTGIGRLRSQMSKAERLALSKSVFKSLRSENYQDSPMLSPEQKRDRYARKQRRKNRRKHRDRKDRNRIPNRRRAFEIASADVLKSNSFCRTELLKQRIRMEGCLTKTIVNRFCFGQCQSFFIPKLRRNKLKAAFESCSACMPIDYAPVAVTLHCPARNPPVVRRTVMKVKRCTCKAVRTS